ncbi:SNF2 family N-terminal domain-containing protein [Emericellopsis atlantica]|uniref:SNF2 family N-terminal domain-containing protein n=1 Tax=Emericellopsis atlantica TaxID=2614577 RepID=A0A9P8CWF1_9HYPO|nr:SNF2 family N-terminal domain-containing protein [Emericellopsis atlantica]KAG9258556.1 SNF2 family N-terminal domain-containing protein [Emericellopsis atlantica]
MEESEIQQLRDERELATVMLESLIDTDYPGAEEERAAQRADIARFDRLIAKAERGELAVEDNDNEVDFSFPNSRPSPPRAATPGPSNESLLSQQTLQETWAPRPRTPPSAMPQTQPRSANLPSRKRERSSTITNAEPQPKSRRSTPTPAPARGPAPPASSRNEVGSMDDFDFIDLTGFDDEDDGESAYQRARSDHHRRWRDAHRNGLQEARSSATPSVPIHTYRPAAPAHPHYVGQSMPGQWPVEGNGAPAPRRTSTAENSNDPWSFLNDIEYAPFNPSPAQNRGGPPRGFVINGPPIPSQPVQPLYHPTQPGIPGFMNVARGVLGDGMRQVGNGLQGIINRTADFDYVNMLDPMGNPLSERHSRLADMMQDSRVSEKELEDLFKNIRPDMDIPEGNRGSTPAGLDGTLYPHQEVALTWLKQMEEGTNKGGILADDMGLGKTISMISLMLERKADGRPKTNLVVGPVALTRQWEAEVKSKIRSSHRMSTFIHHSSKKASRQELMKYDVVLTTYGTLGSEMSRMAKMKDEKRTIDWEDRTNDLKFPLLHPKTKFYRIMLDEAQSIKNVKTWAAKAAHELQSEYRWCLTGTPMMNGVRELFSLIQFLRIKPYCEFEEFKKTFGRLFGLNGAPQAHAMKQLRILLKAIMLRRKKDSLLDGKPILQLPPKTEDEIHVKFSEDESSYYKTLETKSQVIFNKYLREGTVGKNYSNILVLLLRLRQACCHPHLNIDLDESGSSPGSTVAASDKALRELDPSTVERIKATEAFECPICYDAVPNPSFFVPCGHDSCSECLAQLIDKALTDGLGGDEGNGAFCKCPECRTHFNPKMCFNFETFKEVHMPDPTKAEASGVKDEDKSETEWETDTDVGAEDEVDGKGNLKDFIVDDSFSSSDEDDKGKARADEPPKKRYRRKKKPSKDKGKAKAEEDDTTDVKPTMLAQLRKDGRKNQHLYKKYMAYLRKTWLPSAKVTECMKLLRSFEDTDGAKTIIFSQWTLLLDLLEVAIGREELPGKLVRYDGGMSSGQRNEAALNFERKPDIKVILVSLRAGNAGLNLTAASRVIIMDPFWNPYIEMQAVDRAYRIGQKKEVKVYRILTQETVEDRIVELQTKKKEVVEAALDEDESKKIGRLSHAELKYLFTGSRN